MQIPPLHHLPTRVGPGTKLEVALLVVKGEPGDVDLARRLRRESFERINRTRKSTARGCTAVLLAYLQTNADTNTNTNTNTDFRIMITLKMPGGM